MVITDGFDLDEYEVYNGVETANNSRSQVSNQSLLTFFANLEDEQIEALQNCCNITPNGQNIAQYIEKVIQEVAKQFDESVANVISLSLLNKASTMDKKDSLAIVHAQQILFNSIHSAVLSAKFCCDAVSKMADASIEVQIKTAQVLLLSHPNIQFVPLVAVRKKTNHVTYCGAFCVFNELDFFTLMAVLTIKGNKSIKKCRNCNKYFVPISKRDEIYCANCRDVTYDKKIKENEILSSYRRIYKTQSARKQRNSHRPHINEKFECWKHMAILKRNECKSGLITLSEMETAISSQDWLEGIGDSDGVN